MTLKQALNIVNETRIHMVVESTEGHFETETLDYLAAREESFSKALEFATKWRKRKVSYIRYNKARKAIEISCYM